MAVRVCPCSGPIMGKMPMPHDPTRAIRRSLSPISCPFVPFRGPKSRSSFSHETTRNTRKKKSTSVDLFSLHPPEFIFFLFMSCKYHSFPTETIHLPSIQPANTAHSAASCTVISPRFQNLLQSSSSNPQNRQSSICNRQFPNRPTRWANRVRGRCVSADTGTTV